MAFVPLWFVLIAVLWTGFFVLEGFDMGVGMLHGVIGKDETGKQTVLATSGPLWDGNEVWLVAAAAGMRRVPRLVCHSVLRFLPACRPAAGRPHPARDIVRVPGARTRRGAGTESSASLPPGPSAYPTVTHARCHALVLRLPGLPGRGPRGLGACAGLPGMRSRRML
jgi:hypothetical protein